MTSPKEDSLPGTVIDGRYRIIARLSEGGMGVVYRAEHVFLKREVALKRLHREMTGHGQAVARFEREAQAAAKIDHPNVCQVLDCGVGSDGTFFIAMELLDGRSLDRRIAEAAPLPLGEIVDIGAQICDALQRAHALEIVHRDLKPENVMLVPKRDGPGVTAKIMDFGIAKVAQEGEGKKLTQAGMIFGTPAYMAPEQAAGGQVDARADIYAMGVILFEMATGHCPFEAPTLSGILTKHLTEPAPPLELLAPHLSYPLPFREIVARCLVKDPGMRFASATALGAALRVCAGMTALAVAPAPTTAEHMQAPTILAAPGTLGPAASGGPAPGPPPGAPGSATGYPVPAPGSATGYPVPAPGSTTGYPVPVPSSATGYPLAPPSTATAMPAMGAPTLARRRVNVPWLVGGGIAGILLLALLAVLIGQGGSPEGGAGGEGDARAAGAVEGRDARAVPGTKGASPPVAPPPVDVGPPIKLPDLFESAGPSRSQLAQAAAEERRAFEGGVPEVGAALTLAQGGKVREAIAQMQWLSMKLDANAHYHFEMAVLFGKDRKLPQAMEHALRAVEIDGRYAGDAELLALADGALANRNAANDAERFFERVLDAEIAQHLVRSVLENARQTTVARRVHDLLVRRSLLDAVPEWLRQPLRVVAAADCTARKAVLGEILARPDGRMAASLRRFKAESGCGILGMQDCWSCERGTLRDVLAAVDAAARSGSGSDAGG